MDYASAAAAAADLAAVVEEVVFEVDVGSQ